MIRMVRYRKKWRMATLPYLYSADLKLTEKSAIIAGYDQPLTEHTTNNPHPIIPGFIAIHDREKQEFVWINVYFKSKI